MTDAVVAAIDCGTHSTRLLVERAGVALVRDIELTRLGEGLRSGGELAPAALARVYDALARYRTVMDRHEVERTRVAATSAVRDASNGNDFLMRGAEIIGAPIEVLGGDAEARLGFIGATADLDPADGPFLVVDIGGGSTEFAYGTSECEAAMSLDIGSVRLSEKYLESDPPRPEELSACITITEAWLDDIDREMPEARGARTVIGVAGTVSTAVAVEIGLHEYDRERLHHFVLTREAAEDVFRTLATERRADRAANPGLPAGRVDTIVGGMSILVKVMRHFDLPTILASESDSLDGLARQPSMMRKRTSPAAAPWLTGRRVTLRPLREGDFEQWREVRLANEDWLTKWEPLRPPHAPDPVRDRSAFLVRCDARRRDRQSGVGFSFGVFVGDEFGGEMNLSSIHRGAHQNAYIGYWVDRRKAGNGYTPEALVAVMRFAFDELALHRLQISIIPRNSASRRVVEKLDIRAEGIAQRYLQINGVWEDHIRYAMTSEEWALLGGQLSSAWLGGNVS